MTDFVVGSTLTADASQFTSEMEKAGASLKDVENAARDAGTASGGLGTGTKQAETAAKGLGDAAKKTREELDREADAKHRGANEAKAAAQADKALADAKAKLAAESSRAGSAGQALGSGIASAAQSAATGASAVAALSGAVVAGAGSMEKMGGKLGAVAGLLTGPWGEAIIGGATLLGTLALAALTAGDASDKQAEAAKRLKEAEDELNKAAAAVTRTAYGEAQAHLATARSIAEQEIKTRNLTAAKLQQAREEVRISTIRAQAPGQRGELAQLTLDVDTRRAAGLDAALTAAQTKADDASRRARILEVPVARLNAAVATDKAAAANRKYEETEARLIKQRADGAITEKQLQDGITQATRAREAATKATSDHSGASTGLADAQARVAAADSAVSKAAANLALVRKQSAAELKAGTITQAEYTARVTEATRAVNDARAAVRADAEARREGRAAVAAHNKEVREAEAATRQAAAAQRQLNTELKQILARYDPAAAAAMRYAEALKDIAKLQGAGAISAGDASFLERQAAGKRIDEEQAAWDKQVEETGKRLGGTFQHAMDTPLADAKDLGEQIKRDFGLAGKEVKDAGKSMADAIEQVIGGKAGRGIGAIVRVLEQQGRPGGTGILGLPSIGNGSVFQPRPGGILNALGGTQGGFLDGFQKAQNKFETGINKIFGDVFGAKGLFGQTLGQNLGQALGGAQIGGQFGKPITNLLGIKGSNTGAQIGGAIGSFLPIPGGEIIGSVLGSVFGGLLKSVPRASATITSVNDKAAVAGNNQGLRQAASGLATSVQGGLQQIADTLGGGLGSFSVSIGVRNKNFRVDPTGRGITKTKKGALDFGTDEGAAISAAIRDAITDGAVTGLSAAVQQALKSSDNLDKALKEALGVQEVENIVNGINGQFMTALRAFEKQAADRLRIAKQYGFDVVAIEKRNAEDRKAIVDQELASRTGGLQSFRDSLTTGQLFEGSEVDRRNLLFGKLGGLQDAVAAGKEGAGNDLAQALADFVQSSKSAFGTAGPEYAADRAKADEIARQTIEMERKRIEDAAAAVAQTNASLATANQLLDEGNNQNAQILDQLKQLNASILFGGGANRVNLGTIAAV